MDAIQIIYILLAFLVSPCFTQNCTGNEFIKNGTCYKCGLNSFADRRFQRCLCDNLFLRFHEEAEDYEKPCYRVPNEPENFTLSFVSGTSAAFSWKEPSIIDPILKTLYDFGISSPNCQNNCKISNWTRNLKSLEFVKTGLIPYKRYGVVVCSVNNASRKSINYPRFCNDDHIFFTTNKTAPSAILKQNVVLSLVSRKLKLSFSFPPIIGSDRITINAKCGSQETISKLYTDKNKTETFAMFDQPCGTRYLVCSVFAENDIGAGPKTNATFSIGFKNCDDHDDDGPSNEIIAAYALVGVLVLASAVGALIFFKWKKTQDAIIKEWNRQIEAANQASDNIRLPFRPHNIYVDALDVETSINELKNMSMKQQDDDEYLVASDYNFEFPRDSLNILQRLGEGNFAVVFKAEAENIGRKSGTSIVAVKVLKEEACEKDKVDFEEELKLMKSLPPHKNVVQLLGCCTGKGNMAMIVEYLPFGDLLDVLRKSKQQPEKDGKPYSMFSEEDFITFAHDIVSGMNHLSNQNIIHRDLACRNILVSKNRCCKVADLGLARVTGADGIYKREKEAKLPVKWMAPESLFYGTTTTISDVWSFGICFWEIITLGSLWPDFRRLTMKSASPYPGYKSKDVVSLLQQSYRMPKPSHCSNKLYDIMMDCWEENPNQRPSFKDLQLTFEGLLHQDEINYMNFDAFEEDMYVKFDDDDDDIAAGFPMM